MLARGDTRANRLRRDSSRAKASARAGDARDASGAEEALRGLLRGDDDPGGARESLFTEDLGEAHAACVVALVTLQFKCLDVIRAALEGDDGAVARDQVDGAALDRAAYCIDEARRRNEVLINAWRPLLFPPTVLDRGGTRARTSRRPLSAAFHSFRLIFGRAIIPRSTLDAWTLVREGARAENPR